MNKKEVKQKIEYHLEQFHIYTKLLEHMKDELKLSDENKPFREWTLIERQNLSDIDKDAAEWFLEEENEDKTIGDYNETQIRNDKKIQLEK